LFLVLDLAVESGATAVTSEVHVGATIGVLLAMITLVHAFTEALVIAGHYIIDTWEGHFLAKQFIFKKFSDVAVDWVFFFFFLFCPLLVMCVTLFMQYENWWSITSITWFTFVLAFYILFCFNVVYYEVKAAWQFCKNRSDADCDNWKSILKRCFMLRQIYTYGGKKKESFIAKTIFRSTEDTEDVDKSEIYEDSHTKSTGIWTRITETYLSSFFTTLDPPRRLYTMEDVQDYRPFMTRNTWR
jgi:hypothetical protein